MSVNKGGIVMAKKKQDMSVEAVIKRAQKNVAHKAPKSKVRVVYKERPLYMEIPMFLGAMLAGLGVAYGTSKLMDMKKKEGKRK
jgi:hypothetical protein